MIDCDGQIPVSGVFDALKKIYRVLSYSVKRISTFEHNKRWQIQRAYALAHRDVVLCQNLEIGYRVAGKGIEAQRYNDGRRKKSCICFNASCSGSLYAFQSVPKGRG